jgi:simple sugar transport system ATP-binding protein
VAVRRRAGLAFIPEDRQRHGLVLDFSLAENLLLGQEHKFCREPFGLRIDHRALWAHAAALLADYDVRPNDPNALCRSLSGGNQQKIVVARELSSAPRALIAAQPTRGVDIGAIAEIHRRLLMARDSGCAILLISAELDEVLALADRIFVLYRGRFVAELPNPSDAPPSRADLGVLMTGATSAEPHAKGNP